MICCTRYIQPQLTRELVHNITSPGQRTKRNCFDTSMVGFSKVVRAIRMAVDVPDRYSIETSSRWMTCSRTLYQRPWPLAFTVSASVASMVYEFTWTSASSFFFCASACTFTSSFCSQGTEVSPKKKALGPLFKNKSLKEP